jgi:secreted trypsin-like serine protease
MVAHRTRRSGHAKHGGTCFGDSGGPTFAARTNTVVAVTSYGFSSQCGGVGGVYRIATDLALDWLAEFD